MAGPHQGTRILGASPSQFKASLATSDDFHDFRVLASCDAALTVETIVLVGGMGAQRRAIIAPSGR